MNDVEDLLRSELSAMADAVGSGPVPAHELLQHGRRARRRRQAVAVGAGAVLTAAAVAVVGGFGPRPLAQDPVVPATSAPVDRPDAVQAWVDGLPVAQVPIESGAVPSGTVRWQGRERTLPAPPAGLGDGARAVGAVGDDWLVEWNTDGFTGAEDFDARLGRLTAEGRWQEVDTLDVTGVAVAPGGGTYAVSGETASTGQGVVTRLTVRRSGDDAVVAALTVPRGTTVRGWIGGRVAVTTSEGTLKVLDGDLLLTLGDALPDDAVVTAVGPDVLEVAVPSDTCPEGRLEHSLLTFEGINASGSRRLGCAAEEAAFLSPDGTHVVTTREPFTILVVPDGPVVSTGGPALPDGVLPPAVRWEEDGRHVVVSYLVDGTKDEQPTLVRCAVADGSCTRDQ